MRVLWKKLHNFFVPSTPFLFKYEQLLFEASLIVATAITFLIVLLRAPAVPLPYGMATNMTLLFILARFHFRSGTPSGSALLVYHGIPVVRMYFSPHFIMAILSTVGAASLIRLLAGVPYDKIWMFTLSSIVGYTQGRLTPLICTIQKIQMRNDTSTDENHDDSEINCSDEEIRIVAKRLPAWIVKPPR